MSNDEVMERKMKAMNSKYSFPVKKRNGCYLSSLNLRRKNFVWIRERFYLQKGNFDLNGDFKFVVEIIYNFWIQIRDIKL